ncbi:head-tail connector protein [Ectopseudomonas mendocina]|uniref:head-tail connector protein n=1 Tax=Ectopseudomonas mendocina TaxID=300 RepID=UPI00376F039F
MVSLDRVKQHLRVDHGEEDELIQAYLESAVAYVERYCDRQIVDPPPAEGEDPIDPDKQMLLTKDLQQVMLLLVGHWFNNREAVVIGTISNAIPMAVESLLWQRKNF